MNSDIDCALSKERKIKIMDRNNSLQKFSRDVNNEFNHFYKVQIIKFNEPIVIFGLDGTSESFLKCLCQMGCPKLVSALCDNEKRILNTEINGIPVLSFDEVKKKYPNPSIIIYGEYEREIRDLTEQIGDYGKIINQSLKLRVAERAFMQKPNDDYYNTWFKICSNLYRTEEFKKNIELLETLLVDEDSKQVLRGRINFLLNGDIEYLTSMYCDTDQYFVNDYYNHALTKSEIYIDLGTYDGFILEDMINYVDAQYEKIYAFEPNPESYKKIKTLIQNKKWDNIETFPMGTGIEKSKVSFKNEDAGSCIDVNGSMEIEIDALDNIIKGPVTLIKMDVEGAELDTLKGSKNLIQKYKPKLAISIYHNCEDIFTLPLYIHELVPEYKFKIRHYSYSLFETILYADIY